MANTTNHKANKGSFQKGDDPKRNKNGQRNKAAVTFARTLRELIVKEGERSLKDDDGKKHKKIELMIRQLWNKAILGEAWAVNAIMDRVEGKVKDQFEHSGEMTVHDSLSDDERASRIVAILDAARARRDRQSGGGGGQAA